MKQIYILPVIIMCFMPTVSMAEGEIRVVVKDIVTGSPISGAKVRARVGDVDEEVTGLTTNSRGEVIVKRTDFTNSDVSGNHNYNVQVDITLTDAPGGYYIDDAYKGVWFGTGLTGQVADPVVFELSKYIHFDVVSADDTPIELADVTTADSTILCTTFGGKGCNALQQQHPDLTSEFTYLVTHDDYDTARGTTRFDGGTVSVRLSPKAESVAEASAEEELPAGNTVEEEQVRGEAEEQQTDDTPTQNGDGAGGQNVVSTGTTSSAATQDAAASDTGNDRQRGQCTDTAKQTDPNVRYAKWQKKQGEYVCSITECVRGYEPNDAGTECVAKMVLPEDKSAERIDELQGVYNEAKKNEISDANKMLGGASMGATGAGGMMLSMGLAEQKADNAAYEQMRGYVSTFKCNYGANNIEYSVEPTQLPTSTELTNLYAEYVTLANDLKMRKSVLGLRAGLESQPILDSATSGLYDDVSSGRETGTFTSLARAILDPDGEDAKRWAEQTKKSKNLIIAGGVTAGVGAVGGIVGNLLINKDAPNLQSVREKIDDINKRYEEFYKEFERVADDLGGTLTVTRREEDPEKEEPTDNNGEPPHDVDDSVEEDTVDDTTQCPHGTIGSYPDCICSDIRKRFNLITRQCEDVNVASIEVPRVRPPVPATIIPLGGTGDLLTQVGGVTQLTPLQIPTDITLSIPGKTLFDTGKYKIKGGAEDSLRKLIRALKTLNTTLQQGSYDVTVTGHTDTEGGINSGGNQKLSQNRANAVGKFLEEEARLEGLTLQVNTLGKAGTECTCASGLTEDSTEAEFSERTSMTCQKTVHPFDNPQCCADATDYAAAKDKYIPDNTKFEPCRRVDVTFTLLPTEAGSLADYGITGIGNITLTMEQIENLANQATTATE